MSVKDQVQNKMTEYEGQLEKLEEISLSQEDRPQHACDNLAAEMEKERDDEASLIPPDLDPSEGATELDISITKSSTEAYAVEFSNIIISPSQYA